jgi:hypothetical protein
MYSENTDVPKKHQRNRRTPMYPEYSDVPGEHEYVSVLRVHRYSPDTSVFSGYVGVF